MNIVPSPISSKNDFDFLRGKFNVQHKKLKSRLNNCTEWITFEGTHEMKSILNGIGNIEIHRMVTEEGVPIEGMAMRLFNPKTRLWSIYWADSHRGILETPVIGSFDKNKGSFFARDFFSGKEILVQFLWDKSDAEKPVWSQAFSDDNGKTWEWNWYMHFTKVADPPGTE